MKQYTLLLAIVIINTFSVFSQSLFPEPSIWLKSETLSDTLDYWKEYGKDSLPGQTHLKYFHYNVLKTIQLAWFCGYNFVYLTEKQSNIQN